MVGLTSFTQGKRSETDPGFWMMRHRWMLAYFSYLFLDTYNKRKSSMLPLLYCETLPLSCALLCILNTSIKCNLPMFISVDETDVAVWRMLCLLWSGWIGVFISDVSEWGRYFSKQIISGLSNGGRKFTKQFISHVVVSYWGTCRYFNQQIVSALSIREVGTSPNNSLLMYQDLSELR